VTPTTNYYNPWTGSIYMWPGPRAPPPPHTPAPPSHQAYIASPPAQWAGHWSVPPLAPVPTPQPSPPPGWDQQALAASFETMSVTQPPQRDWYFDTGATSHMASDTGILSSLSLPTVHSPSSIVVGNGNLLPVTATGSTHLPHNFNLNNVLVSPNLIKNLVSVRRFTIDNNCSVEFDPFGCSVKDLPTRREIVRCNSSGPLYPLQLPAPALLAATSSTLWHQCVGHPGREALSRLASTSAISCNKGSCDTLCHACQLGRHVRLPFQISSSCATHSFQLIHCDLWTSPITSMDFTYY
jgi:hypothetical protein